MIPNLIHSLALATMVALAQQAVPSPGPETVSPTAPATSARPDRPVEAMDAPAVEASSDPSTADSSNEGAEHEPQLTKMPELVHFEDAPYPPEAEAAKVEGAVTLLVDLDGAGNVTDAQVVVPAGHGFDEAAAKALLSFKFTPAEIDGVPAPVQFEYVYRFVFRPPPPSEGAAGEGTAPEVLPVSLKVRALERASRRPVARALVRCSQAGGGECPGEQPETTDAEGNIQFRLPAGAYELEVISEGHEPFLHEESVVDGDVLQVTYHLMPLATGGYRTIVKGERERREATRRTITREEIQTVPGTMGDAVRAIQNLPGVARSAYLGGQLSVRGAAPSETLSYMDGVEIPILFHFLGGPSVINPEFVDEIDFLPGGFGPRYGRATGGVVNARTRRGSGEGIHGSFKVDLVDAAVFLEAALGEKTSVAVAARRSYIDAVLSQVTASSDDFGTVSIVPRYWDYQLRLDHGRPSDRDRFSLMLFGSDDKMTASTSGGARSLDLDLGGGIGFHRVKGEWVHADGIFQNELSPAFGYDKVDMDMSGVAEGASGFAVEGRVMRASIRDEASWKVAGVHRARVGVDASYDRTELTGSVPFSSNYRPLPGSSGLTEMTDIGRTYDTLSIGLYHVWDLEIAGRLSLMPGVRADMFLMDGHAKWAVDPRISARFKLTDDTVLKGGVGHYSQAPSVTYLDEDVGNPDLKFTKAIQSSLGVEHKFGYGLSLDVTGFFIFGYDRVAYSDRMEVGDTGEVKAENYVNGSKSRNYGVELMAKKELTDRLSGWLAYTLSRSERNTPSSHGWRRSSYDQTHILAAVARYKLGRGWSVGARFRLVSGNAETPVKDSTFDADTGSYVAITGEPYSDRAPLFHQLDLRVDKEWTFKTWKLGVYLDIQNAYWADNTEYVVWDYRYRGNTGLAGMPFFPTLGAKGSF